jgi:hypothetical protein
MFAHLILAVAPFEDPTVDLGDLAATGTSIERAAVHEDNAVVPGRRR